MMDNDELIKAVIEQGKQIATFTEKVEQAINKLDDNLEAHRTTSEDVTKLKVEVAELRKDVSQSKEMNNSLKDEIKSLKAAFEITRDKKLDNFHKISVGLIISAIVASNIW